jgi:DNA-binding MarR family transcriptional regulator
MKLNETIEFYIRTTSLALSRMYNSIAAKYGITQTIGYLLTYVERQGTPSTRLAQQLGMKNSSLTRLLKKMENDGCILRKVSPDDKRVVKIFLTEKGVARRKIAKKSVLDFNQKLLSKVDEKEMAIFLKVFDIIKEQVNIELGETQPKQKIENQISAEQVVH